MKLAAVFGRIALALALFLPLAATTQQQETQQQRAQSQPYNNAPIWRDVRSGKEEYTSIKGRETGVLVQTYGETWRQLKNGWITPIAGWLIAAVVVVIGVFFKWRGSIKVHGEPTGRLIERFTPFERYTHWVVAISFVILGISGLVMMLGKYVLLPVIGYTLFAWLAQLSKHLHNFVGPVLVVSASGLVLLFPNFDQVRAVMIEANVVHAVAAGAVLAISLGHIYLGTIGLEGAYEAMRNGYVDETWAREHHEYWYNDVKSGKIKAGTAIGQPDAPQAQH